MRVRRHLVAVLGPLTVLCAPAVATAGAITHRDANDVAGRLGVKWARHGHSGGDMVHTIGTWASFSSRALGGANMVAFVLDTNRRRTDDPEWWAHVYWANGRLRAELVDASFASVTPIPVRRPARNRLQVTIPGGALGGARAYRWFVATVDGHAHDFAPDRGGVLHDLTRPTIKLTSFPRLSTDVAAGDSFPVAFSVSDVGGAGIATWRLERRLPGTAAWSRVRGGTTGGEKSVTIAGAEGQTYAFRVVAVDAQRNRWMSAVRTVSVPFDDANALVTYEGAWRSGEASTADFHGTLHTAGGAGASATCAFTGRWVALVGRGLGGTAWVSIDGGADREFSIPEGAERTVLLARDLATSGPHTIRVTSAATPFALDAVASR